MKLHKQPKGTRNYTLRRTGTMAEKGEVALIYTFGTNASVGGTTHVDAHKGMWTREISTRSLPHLGSRGRHGPSTATWSDAPSASRR